MINPIKYINLNKNNYLDIDFMDNFNKYCVYLLLEPDQKLQVSSVILKFKMNLFSVNIVLSGQHDE